MAPAPPGPYKPTMQQISRDMGPAEWAMLLALSVIWGGSFFFFAIAVTALPTFTIVALRLGPQHAFGMLAIGLGLALIDGRLFRRRSSA